MNKLTRERDELLALAHDLYMVIRDMALHPFDQEVRDRAERILTRYGQKLS